MLRWTKWVAPMAALVLMAGIQAAPTRADDTSPTTAPTLSGKATITVTVVDSNGAPVPEAKISLMPPRARRQKGGATTQPDGSTPPASKRPTPLETGVAGADGTFALTNVPDGEFIVTARLKGSGNGMAKVTVADDKDMAVTVTLKAKKAKTPAPAN